MNVVATVCEWFPNLSTDLAYLNNRNKKFEKSTFVEILFDNVDSVERRWKRWVSMELKEWKSIQDEDE